MSDRYDTSFRLANRLRDIVLPDGASWWPPALGWWLLAGAVLPLSLAAVWIVRQRYALRREALRYLRDEFARYQANGDARALLAGLSILLKRVAIAREGRSKVAALQGKSWIAHLDSRNGSEAFSSGVGKALASLQYMPQENVDELVGRDEIRELMPRVRRWLRLNT